MNISGFNTFDIIVMILVLVPAVRGLYRGLLEEATALLSVILGVVAASRYYPEVAPLLEKVFNDPKLIGILAYALVFCAAALLVSLFGKVVQKIISVSFASWLNHLAGCVLGAGVGLILACLAYLVIHHFAPEADMLKQSQLAPYLEQVVQDARALLPQLLSGGFDWQPQLPEI